MAVAEWTYCPAIVSDCLMNIMKASVWVPNLRARDLNPRPTEYEPLVIHPAAKFCLMMRKVMRRRVGCVINVNRLGRM
jgi:hypothetical protein